MITRKGVLRQKILLFPQPKLIKKKTWTRRAAVGSFQLRKPRPTNRSRRSASAATCHGRGGGVMRVLLQAFDNVEIGEGADVAVDVGLGIRSDCDSTDGIDARGVRWLQLLP
jgi:hypothetical protein